MFSLIAVCYIASFTACAAVSSPSNGKTTGEELVQSAYGRNLSQCSYSIRAHCVPCPFALLFHYYTHKDTGDCRISSGDRAIYPQGHGQSYEPWDPIGNHFRAAPKAPRTLLGPITSTYLNPALPIEYEYSRKRTTAGSVGSNWGEWMNNNDYHPLIGDNNTYANLGRHYSFCSLPENVQCRDRRNPHISFEMVKQEGVVCNVSIGLDCRSGHSNGKHIYCLDYELRVLCCKCPEPEKITTTTQADTSSTAILTSRNGLNVNATLTSNLTTIHYVEDNLYYILPVVIIVAAIGFLLLIFVIIICVVRRKTVKRRKSSKHSHHYLAGEMPRFQRPVSFTDIDHRYTRDSSLSRSSLEGTLEKNKHKNLEKGKLMFQSSPRDQPDIINSTPHAINPFEHYDSETPRRWLPDEYERSLDKQGPRGARNNWLARTFTPTSQKIIVNVDEGSN